MKKGALRFVIVCSGIAVLSAFAGDRTAVIQNSSGVPSAFLPAPERFSAERLVPGFSEFRTAAPHPSRAGAFFLSLLLPGAGEYYAGSKKMAGIFLGTEALLWSTFTSFRVYGKWKKNDYERMAIAHAGVSAEGKDHDYFVALELYDNIREYNAEMMRNRDFDALFPENEEYSWQWDSRESRLKYERLRVASDNAFERSLLVVGGVLLNHLFSAVDALRLAQGAAKGVEVGLAPLPEGGFVLGIFKQW